MDADLKTEEQDAVEGRQQRDAAPVAAVDAEAFCCKVATRLLEVDGGNRLRKRLRERGE